MADSKSDLEWRLETQNNNFNLLRLIASILVIFSHSFELISAYSPEGFADPLRPRFGYSIGGIAVDIFFFASGLLCARSLKYSRNVTKFLRKRVMRIWPGLVACVLLSVVILGIIFHREDLSSYLGNKETLKFCFLNCTLVFGLHVNLPGIFYENPFNPSVNGSLWTLPREVGMYLTLAASGLAANSLRENRTYQNTWLCRHWLQIIGSVWILLSGTLLYLQIARSGAPPFWEPSRFFYMFGAGVFSYAFLRFLDMRKLYFLFLQVGGGMLVGGIFYIPLVKYLYPVGLPLLVFCFGFGRYPLLERFKGAPDYSYGLYLYAWPCQQLLVHFLPNISVQQLFGSALLTTACIAAMSWHIIEKPMLRLK